MTGTRCASPSELGGHATPPRRASSKRTHGNPVLSKQTTRTHGHSTQTAAVRSHQRAAHPHCRKTGTLPHEDAETPDGKGSAGSSPAPAEEKWERRARRARARETRQSQEAAMNSLNLTLRSRLQFHKRRSLFLENTHQGTRLCRGPGR